MDDSYKKVKDLFGSANKILIVLNNQASYDTHAAAAALFLYLKDQKKNISLCLNGEPALKHKRLIDKYEITYVTQIKPLSYVITLDHAGDTIDKVGWDDKEGKFHVYITPAAGSKSFDFEKVAYSYGGSDYDLIIVFGARSLKWLGDLYIGNKSVFERSKIVNINNLNGSQEFGDVKLVESNISTSEIVYGLIRNTSFSSINKVVELLAKGLVEYLQPLQRSEYKVTSVENLAALVKNGADLKSVFKDLYYSRDSANFRIVQRLMSNLKIDPKAGLAWSGVSSFDFAQSGVNKSNFELDGRIIFDIAEPFRFAVALYEVMSDEVWVEAESNESSINARDIFKGHNPTGNSARVVFVVKGKSMAEVEDEVLGLLKAPLGVSNFVPSSEVPALEEVGAAESENEPEVLTEGQKTGDNMPSKGNGQVLPPPVAPEES